jgi:hypothetical protein
MKSHRTAVIESQNHVSILTLYLHVSVKTFHGSTSVKSKKHRFINLSAQKSD